MRNLFSAFRHSAVVLSLLLLAFALVPVGFAQETTGAIQGTVTDPSGAVVVGATVTATSEKLIKSATATTDTRGYYRLSALPPGKYSIVVSGSGMTAKATNLELNAGDLPNLNIKMAVGAETIIDVADTVAMVDVTQSKVETTITQQAIQELPKGRSFQSIISFAPGARQEPLQSVAGSATNAYANSAPVLNSGRTNGYQIDGASDAENIYLLDGLNITSVYSGGAGSGVGALGGFNVPFEFVQDVQVKSSSFEAQYGGALGGVVNVISQTGGNNWHGRLFTYYRSSALNANDQCAYNYTTMCGLRLDPLTSANSSTRTDASAQYYIAKQDHYRIVEPGFQLGGPLLKDKLNFYASFVPQYYSQRRSVNFIGANAGPRDFYSTQNTYYGFSKVSYSPFSKLRLFGEWEYSMARAIGTNLPNPDSRNGQRNSSATTDPTTFRQDTGTVNPASLYLFGADYTINSRTLLSVRYGYTYANAGDRGKPVGLRYLYSGSATSSTKALDGSSVPTAYQNSSGFANIGLNSQQLFNVYKRKGLTTDLSYLKTGWAGTHTFQGGFSMADISNKLLVGYNTAEVDLYYGQAYTVGTGAGACAGIIAANQAAYGPTATDCRGNYGYFIVHDGVDSTGEGKSKNYSLYFQDAWSVGRSGLTINAGVRFDKEFLPPYSAGAPSISFGFTQKVAPRIGVAYDVLHNGKLKLFASYGQFFDIMKYSLPQGSFGGQYWHDCAYAMDDPNYNLITPSAPGNHGCPAAGSAPGVTVGRFIENLDYRKNITNTQDPGVDPNIKPMKQHEIVVGSEWAVKPTLIFSARYAHKRLDNTIEDIGATDNLGFYIGNPGPGYGDLLHRTLFAAGYTAPLCAQCPAQPMAHREYDGLEFRLAKTGKHYNVTGFYTYSRLNGNYPGLTSSFISDGGGGRQSPNNNRSFDSPQQQFDSHGALADGRLPTDRPNTFSSFGSYTLPSFLGETSLGLTQIMYQGTPLSTCWPAGSSTSTCQFVEGQGNWVNLHRASNGDVVVDSITKNRRTPWLSQTGANLRHYVSVSKEHENRKFGAEFNVSNVLNQRAVTTIYPYALTAAAVPSTTSNPTGYDFNAMLTGWNYAAVSNGVGAASGQTKTVSNRYGQPALFQAGRTMMIKVAYVF